MPPASPPALPCRSTVAAPASELKSAGGLAQACMLSRVSCRSLVTSARGGAPNMRLRENWEATIWLQLVPDSRHHPGIHRPLYPLLYLTAQRFHFLCREIGRASCRERV